MEEGLGFRRTAPISTSMSRISQFLNPLSVRIFLGSVSNHLPPLLRLFFPFPTSPPILKYFEKTYQERGVP